MDRPDQSDGLPGASGNDGYLALASGLLAESIELKRKVLASQTERIVEIASALADAFRSGGKILFCGNGGSAADAQHLAAELLVRLSPEVNRQGLPAIALAMDSSAMTAHGNDYGFDSYYQRMVEALGRKGDVLVGISTSGRSPNVVNALEAARRLGMTTVGLLGGDGGAALAQCDIALVVPSHTTGRIQEAHITIGHAIMEITEEMLLSSRHLTNTGGDV